MMKKKMILADWEEVYLNELSYGFMEQDPGLELFTFTKKEALYQYLKQEPKIDILVVDESFAGSELQNMADGLTKIVMSVSMNPVEGFEIIKKYQKNENLLKEILLKYAENRGAAEAIRGNSNTKVVAFYSPAGGTGKTSLALAAAVSGARSGLKTFYLNMEEIDSVGSVLRKSPGTLSDVFLALRTKGMNIGIKLQGCIGLEEQAGFSYISGVDSIAEYEEINGQDIGRLLETIRSLAVFDLVILDLSSGFTEISRQALHASDVIFVPVTMNENSLSKLHRFFEESGIHSMYESIMKKIRLVLNNTGNGIREKHLQLNRLIEKAMCCGGVPTSRELSSYVGILKGNGDLITIMKPVMQMIMQETVQTGKR